MDCYTGCFSDNAALLWNWFGRNNHVDGYQTSPTLVLAGKNEDCIAPGDALASIHGFVRSESERLRQRISDPGLRRSLGHSVSAVRRRT